LTGVPPFNAESVEEIFGNIIHNDIPWTEDISPSSQHLIEQLLDPNQNTRLGSKGAAEVKQHHFFSSVSWGISL
jgi:serum/glucocorticoid-regulated kinase 2